MNDIRFSVDYDVTARSIWGGQTKRNCLENTVDFSLGTFPLADGARFDAFDHSIQKFSFAKCHALIHRRSFSHFDNTSTTNNNNQPNVGIACVTVSVEINSMYLGQSFTINWVLIWPTRPDRYGSWIECIH